MCEKDKSGVGGMNPGLVGLPMKGILLGEVLSSLLALGRASLSSQKGF